MLKDPTPGLIEQFEAGFESHVVSPSSDGAEGSNPNPQTLDSCGSWRLPNPNPPETSPSTPDRRPTGVHHAASVRSHSLARPCWSGSIIRLHYEPATAGHSPAWRRTASVPLSSLSHSWVAGEGGVAREGCEKPRETKPPSFVRVFLP